MGYSQRGPKRSDTTERPHFHVMVAPVDPRTWKTQLLSRSAGDAYPLLQLLVSKAYPRKDDTKKIKMSEDRAIPCLDRQSQS